MDEHWYALIVIVWIASIIIFIGIVSELIRVIEDKRSKRNETPGGRRLQKNH